MIIFIIFFIAMGVIAYLAFSSKNNITTMTPIIPRMLTPTTTPTPTRRPMSNNPLIVACTIENMIYSKKNLDSPWEGPYGGGVRKVIQLDDGTVVGVEFKQFWTRPKLTDINWTGLNSIYDVFYATQLNNGAILGIGGMDLQVYIRNKLTEGCVCPLPNFCCVNVIIQLNDGRFLGIGTDNQLYIKNNIADPWSGTGWNSLEILDVAQQRDGSLLGVGKDNLLYKRNNLTEQTWIKVPNENSLKIRSISVFNY
jgi:hypothetical protein